MNSMTSDGKMDWQNALADKKKLSRWMQRCTRWQYEVGVYGMDK